MNQNQKPTFLVTGKVRLSYVHLFQKYANPQNKNAEPSYNCVVLLPKSDFMTKQRIDTAIAAAIQEGITTKWNGVRPPVIPTPIWDGDGVKQNGMPFGEECRGHWVFTASAKNNQPQIVDLSMNPIIDQSQIYSGIYARVSINFYPYFNSGKAGIGCGLGNVQKLEDGEPLGNRTNAADDFGGAPGYQAPAAPAYAQPYGQPAAPYGAPAPMPGMVPGVTPPGYPAQQAMAPGYPAAAPAPGYPAAPMPGPMPQYGQPYPQQGQAQPQINPVTGQPATGPIMGIPQ